MSCSQHCEAFHAQLQNMVVMNLKVNYLKYLNSKHKTHLKINNSDIYFQVYKNQNIINMFLANYICDIITLIALFSLLNDKTTTKDCL